MDFLTITLPISGVAINPLLLLLLGVAVGVLGGFFGMGGAWMVTPALNIFGFPMPFAVGTDLCHMAGKSIISTQRHAKFGNVDVKLGLIMLGFDVVGIEIGARGVMFLEKLGLAGPVIRWVYVVFLALIGTLVFYDFLKRGRWTRPAETNLNPPSTGTRPSTKSRFPPWSNCPWRAWSAHCGCLP